MVSSVPSHGGPKATEHTKNFKLWNDRKDSPSIRDLTNSRFAEIFLHQSVHKLRAECISQEASNQLKLEVLMSLPNTSRFCKRFYTSVFID